MATNKSNVNPNHYKDAGRERQGEDILQTRHAEARAESGSRSFHAPHESGATGAHSRPSAARGGTAAAAVGTAKKGANTAAKKKNVVKEASTNKQGSDKRGKRSTARKRRRVPPRGGCNDRDGTGWKDRRRERS